MRDSRQWRQFSEDDIPVVLLFAVLSAMALLTPAQNDTFWHLRSGRYIWETKSLLTSEQFSHTAFGTRLYDQWWLSQLVFYLTYAVGGRFLLTIVAGGCALVAVWLSYRLVRGPLELRIALLAFLGLATAPEWAVRPQVISLVLMALCARLIARGRVPWLSLVCVVWANVHAMVVLGVAVAVACAVEAALWSRRLLVRDLIVAAACAAAPTLSPLGLHYWPYVLATVTTSRDIQLQEYRIPLDAAALPFWVAVAVLVFLTATRWRTLSERPREDRVLLVSALVLAVAAVTATRNIAFFAVMAAPALSRLWPGESRPERVRPAKRGAYVLVGGAALAAAAGVGMKWRNPEGLGWQPVSAPAIAAIRACPDPVFNHFEDGGYLMWAVPDKKIFIDSRVDTYPSDLLQRSRAADLFGEYQSVFRDYNIACAVVRTGSPLDASLRRDHVPIGYADAGRTVFLPRPAHSQPER